MDHIESTQRPPIINILKLDFSEKKPTPELIEKIRKIDESPLANRHLVQDDEENPQSLEEILADEEVTSYGIFENGDLRTVVYFYASEGEYDSTHELSFLMTEEALSSMLVKGVSQALESFRGETQGTTGVVFYQTNNQEDSVEFAHGKRIDEPTFAKEVMEETEVLEKVGFTFIEDIEEGNVKCFVIR